jgi:hypothetical protein
MDAETAGKISTLAKNLRDLHLAASTEEAYARAKDIITGNATQGAEKSVNELLAESGVTQEELAKAKKLLEEEERTLKELQKELNALKTKQLEESLHHAEHKEGEAEIDQDIIDNEHDVGVVEENLDLADDVQSEKPA